ncbi:MAG: sulfite exporter TauE/SafE family protein [Planctomycetes bacterium]|jgi:sulfite exporter TauE/SafE|nr:sulfite exporter TauE/SafE family protein [Planctomycetota bacterium]
MTIINGFLLGLATGIFCLAYCAPVYLPQLLAQNDKKNGWKVFWEFNAGRLAAYIIFGAVFGWLGSSIHAQFINTAGRITVIVLAALLILYGFGLALPRFKWCAWTTKIRLPLVSGFLLGVNICPPFLLAIMHNFQTGGALNGVIFFIMFYLGTTVYLLPLTFIGYGQKYRWLQKAGQIAAIAAGTIMIWQTL